MKIGVYICECGINISSTVDVSKVAKKIGKLSGVAVSRNYKYMCSDPGQEMIKKDITALGLDRVVVASCSPRMHEPTFRNTVEEAGLNPYCFEMANIREHCSWIHHDREKATQKAYELVSGSVARAMGLEPLDRKEVGVTPAAMVVGGGIAGIQAALSIADEGFKVYLVEKEPTIGGRMAQLDKTFPTLDCSACILTPKMVDVSRHPNIELLAYSEVTEISGYIGNFTVKVNKKPRYVDEEKCIGCGVCAEHCRLKGTVPNEFDMNKGKRGAIYAPFPQSVPLKYTIDPEKCLMLTRGKCGKEPRCVENCPRDAIDFKQKESIVELNVGTIVVATGFDLFDLSVKPEYGYGKYDNVITGLEFERIVSASGPTGGKVRLNGKYPKNVVFIQCVGSRDRKGPGNEYCSRVCCMYTAKQAHLVREKLPDSHITVYYTDVRAFGKGFEEFYNRIKKEGVTYRRRELDDAIEVFQKDEKTYVKAKGYKDAEADLVVLAVGLVPKSGSKELAHVLNIQNSGDGFYLEAHPKLRPVDTMTDGLFLAGCCQSPKDIPDTVSQANAAASRASIPLARGKVEINPATSVVDEDLCVGCRTCEKICSYSALEYDEERGIMKANEVLCKGCGSCTAACPSGAISLRHYRDTGVMYQLEALLREGGTE
ncbi:MAG: CoB--CoM heterodisulfide reductase iron-sulfur subunit A family protein [Spirochaetales bacterium]|nr:CoB--CoM heterodisulfide reductase iron-sulfur subunit A family protein [Spirochaetales bacterium]